MIKTNRMMGAVWMFIYTFLTLTPLIVLLTGPKIGDRPALLDLSESLAFVGMSLMALQFVVTARIKTTHKPFGTDIIYHFHRQIGIAAFFLVFVHPLLLFILDIRYLRFLNILSAPWRSKMGVVSVLILVGIVWIAEFRKKFNMPYYFWKLLHGILATLMVPMALYHIFTGGNYINMPWKQSVWIGYSILFTVMVIYTRIIYPLNLINKPYQVKEVKPESGSVWTLVMKAINHNGFHFQPGQFAWITAWKTPFSDSEHPFTISSSAEDKNSIQMSIKNLGSFTSKIQSLKPGDKVYIDGPYGYFSIDRFPEVERLVMIPGGIGVTPIMSILRTMADRNDHRPIMLFYCNQEWETLTFREEIRELENILNLTVIYTLERPPQNWLGEKGFLNSSILNKYLSDDWKNDKTAIFLCGPAPMMSAVEKALIDCNFNEKQIHSEKFALA